MRNTESNSVYVVALGTQVEIRVEGGGHGFGAWDRDPSMSGYREKMLEWLARVIH